MSDRRSVYGAALLLGARQTSSVVSLSRFVLLSRLVSELNFRVGVPHLVWFFQMVFNLWWLLQLVLVLFEVCWFLDLSVSRLVEPGLLLAFF
ncbi:unnamed protein product, partial [Brassica oleracea]